MTTVEVFDPSMCCSTGVCGPSVDPALVTFAADLEWLAVQGVQVNRATLSQEPQRFASTPAVVELLSTQGDGALPAVLVDGQVRSSGRYPGRTELAEWAGVPAVRTVLPLAVQAAEPSAGGCCGGGTC